MLKNKAPLVSVIIVNYNGGKLIERCIKSILNTDYQNFEVIAIDNNSTDGSIELVENIFKSDGRLRILKLKHECTLTTAFNVGIMLARGKYIAFQHNDVEVDPSWLKELINVLESDPSVGGAQGKILFYDRTTIDCAGGFLDQYGLLYRRGHFEEDKGQYNEIVDSFIIHDTAMIFRKDCLREVGYFDPDFGNVLEDLDLSLRILLKGYRIVFVPSSITYHMGGGTYLYAKTPFIFKHKKAGMCNHCKNRIMLILKNFQLPNLIRFSIVNLLVIFYLILYNTFTKRPHLAIACFEGILWIVKHFKRIYKKRLEIQKMIRKRDDEDILRITPSNPLGIYGRIKFYKELERGRKPVANSL